MDKERVEVDIRGLANNLDVNQTTKLSEMVSDRVTPIPNFFPTDALSAEALEELDEFDFKPVVALDAAVIEANQKEQENRIELMAGGFGQKVSEPGNDAPYRDGKIFDEVSKGFPSEFDTEELPAEPGGATPPASKGVSNLKGNSDIRTQGNRYGYA